MFEIVVVNEPSVLEPLKFPCKFANGDNLQQRAQSEPPHQDLHDHRTLYSKAYNLDNTFFFF